MHLILNERGMWDECRVMRSITIASTYADWKACDVAAGSCQKSCSELLSGRGRERSLEQETEATETKFGRERSRGNISDE
jgi:hypothetical protein